MSTLVCSVWCSSQDVVQCQPCQSAVLDAGVVTQSIEVASDILFMLSGSQYPGLCHDVIRPQRDGLWGVPHIGQVQVDLSRRVYNDYGTGRNPDGLWEILLPGYPVVSITQIKVDGAVVPPTSYKILDDRWIARVDGLAWPASQDLSKDSSQVGTFEVGYVFGAPPPTMGLRGAAAYACQVAKACTPGTADCTLPPKTQQIIRQGLSARVLVPQDYIDNGRTGVEEADRFIKAVNPHGLRERAVILSPDVDWHSHRMR